MLQTIKVGNDELNVFFDSGYGDMVYNKRALLPNQKMVKKVCKEFCLRIWQISDYYSFI